MYLHQVLAMRPYQTAIRSNFWANPDTHIVWHNDNWVVKNKNFPNDIYPMTPVDLTSDSWEIYTEEK